MYKVVWKEETEKDLAKIDHSAVKRIADKVENYLVKDPLNIGERLLYEWKGFYRCKVGDYRVIYEIKGQTLEILVVKVGHRRYVY